MLKQRIILVTLVSLLSAVVLVFSTGAQTPATCPGGQPPCKNQNPLVGHGLAKNLPASFNCNCPTDERRVVTLRIDSSWNVTDASGTHPNTTIQTALQCAINQWNTKLDQNGNTTHYRLVLDQAGSIATSTGTSTDITVRNQAPSAAGGFAETTTTYPYFINLAPANGNLGGGTFTADDLCGRIAHEIGHKLGITDVGSPCNSIMDGANPDGTRDVNQIQTNDVQQVRNNFNPVTRTNGTCTAPGTDNNTEPINDGGGDPCGGDPCCGDPCCGDPCCGDPCCGDPCCGDPNCGQECYEVCVTYCYSACTAYDDYGECYWTEEICETSCETQCY